RPLRGGGGVPARAGGNGAGAGRLGRASGAHHRRFRAAQSPAHLVPGRAQFSGRAPPVPEDLPRPLSADVADRRGGLRGVRRPLFGARPDLQRRLVALAMAATDGPPARRQEIVRPAAGNCLPPPPIARLVMDELGKRGYPAPLFDRRETGGTIWDGE